MRQLMIIMILLNIDNEYWRQYSNEKMCDY